MRFRIDRIKVPSLSVVVVLLTADIACGNIACGKLNRIREWKPGAGTGHLLQYPDTQELENYP